MEEDETKPVVVGISGGSGVIMAKATVDQLLARRVPVVCTASGAARQVWSEEMEESFHDVLSAWQEDPNFTYYPIGDLRAPIASGTYSIQGMVLVPCSMATVAAIAHGMASNLLQRSADVCLKEGRKLVVVPRETPLSAIHLENLLTLARLGVTVLSPQPAFYLQPQTLQDVVEFLVERTLKALGVTQELEERHQYHRRSE